MMENTSAFRLVVFVFFQAFVVSAALQYDPKPNPGSVVEVGQARFTVLTSNLIRMEWGGTNDAATFAFINRNLPTPQFNTSKDGDWTVIQTTAVTVYLYPEHSNCTYGQSLHCSKSAYCISASSCSAPPLYE